MEKRIWACFAGRCSHESRYTGICSLSHIKMINVARLEPRGERLIDYIESCQYLLDTAIIRMGYCTLNRLYIALWQESANCGMAWRYQEMAWVMRMIVLGIQNSIE